MNMRRTLTSVLMLSLIAAFFLIGVSDYLLRPTSARGQTPQSTEVDARSPKVAPTQPVIGTKAGFGIRGEPIPIYDQNGSLIEVSTKSQVARLQELVIELGRRKNDLRQKEAEIARQQNLLERLQKQRDDLAENATMARALAMYKDQIERFESGSKEPNNVAPGNPAVIPVPPPPGRDGTTADQILQKFEAIEKRLENIERHMPSGRGN